MNLPEVQRCEGGRMMWQESLSASFGIWIRPEISKEQTSILLLAIQVKGLQKFVPSSVVALNLD
jgi:hypothetical protein